MAAWSKTVRNRSRCWASTASLSAEAATVARLRPASGRPARRPSRRRSRPGSSRSGVAFSTKSAAPSSRAAISRRRAAEARQHDHLRRRRRLEDAGQRLEAVHVGHRRVEHHDAGLMAAARATASAPVRPSPTTVNRSLSRSWRPTTARTSSASSTTTTSNGPGPSMGPTYPPRPRPTAVRTWRLPGVVHFRRGRHRAARRGRAPSSAPSSASRCSSAAASTSWPRPATARRPSWPPPATSPTSSCSTWACPTSPATRSSPGCGRWRPPPRWSSTPVRSRPSGSSSPSTSKRFVSKDHDVGYLVDLLAGLDRRRYDTAAVDLGPQHRPTSPAPGGSSPTTAASGAAATCSTTPMSS